MGPARFELSSLYDPPSPEGTGSYTLRLLNASGASIAGFRLGISGPGRLALGARIEGGSIVAQLSTWCEIAPPEGFALADGDIWTVVATQLEFPFHHWTDGTTGALVIHADGTPEGVLVVPTLTTASTLPRRRGTMAMPVPSPAPEPFSIIPWPEHVAVARFRSAPAGLALSADGPDAAAAATSFGALVMRLFPGEAIVRPPEEGGHRVVLEPDPGQPAEGYALSFTQERAVLRAAGSTGFLYGLITLGQMLRGARLYPTSFAFPAEGHIVDRPRLAWRGCHLDVARRFYGTGEIAHVLSILAWNKLNRFHFHLSDDEGWRVALDTAPGLTEVAAWRGFGLALPPMLGGGPAPEGGFYSKPAIAELAGLGSSLGIDIVPEIDVPGHCYALLAAHPELRDGGESGTYHSIQAFPNNCLNPAVDAVYQTLEPILDELAGLFPSRYFHIGADEVPPGAWSGSPLAQALLARIGGGGTAALQAHFLRRIQQVLVSRGKVVGAWEEGAAGGGVAPADSYLVGWHSVEVSRALAARGYDVVVAPGQAYYLDMANGEGWHEPGASWAGWSSPETTYGFEPAAGWSAQERARLLGVQACIWSEPMSDRGVFDRLVFPRLSAIAETGWTLPHRKHYPRFAAVAGLMPNLYGIREGAD